MAYGEKKEEVYGFETFFRETGYFLSRREDYEKALKSFDEAVSKTPVDKRALMGRSLTRAKACQYPGALEDVYKALKLMPDDLIILAHKALVTYLGCEFEEALVQNYRMVPIRKKPDNFTMGVMHCSEAIENCIGERAGRPLRDHFKIIRRLAWKKARDADKPYKPTSKYKTKKKKKKKTKTKKKVVKEPVAPIKSKTKSVKSLKTNEAVSNATSTTVSRASAKEAEVNEEADSAVSGVSNVTDFVPEDGLCIRDSLHSHKTESDFVPPGKPFPYRPLQRYTTNIQNYMAEKYLEKMYLDKIFLNDLKYDLGIKSPNRAGSKKIIQLGKEGLKWLCYKQELLRTRRPFYFIKYQEATLSGKLRARQDAELRKMQATAKSEADALTDKIKKCIQDKSTRIALELSEKLKLYCDSKPKKVLPERENYLDNMYKLVAQAHMEMKRLNKDQFEWDQEKRIYNMLGAPLSREPSTDSVINQFKDVFVDHKKQIAITEERLRKASGPQEMAWLYHDLSRYHTELKQYELGRVYARKCIVEGRRADNLAWVINATMLITRINMQQHNRNDAKLEINDAIGIAKQLNNEVLVEFLEKSLQVVEKMDFDDFHGPKVLEKREKAIIEMMAGSQMKDEATFLFKKMSAMPAARRMSVMPGVRLEDGPDKGTATTRKMSIMPGAKTEDDAPPAPTHAGKAKKKIEFSDESSKGIGFMELIQYHVD